MGLTEGKDKAFSFLIQLHLHFLKSYLPCQDSKGSYMCPQGNSGFVSPYNGKGNNGFVYPYNGK